MILFLSDHRLQHPVGPAVPVPQPGSLRRAPAGPGRVQGGGQVALPRRPLPGGEQAQGVPPADRPHPARLHVRHAAPLRHLPRADRAERGRLRPHGARLRRVQDQAERARPRPLAQRPQLLLQRLVEHPQLQAHEGLPKVRLLPGEREGPGKKDPSFA